MKKLILIILLLGIIEVFYGLLWGRLQVYKYEAPMIRDLGITGSQHREFYRYMTVFKDQWAIVAVFGVGQIVLSLILLRAISYYLNPKRDCAIRDSQHCSNPPN
jgi:hypothetical protein